MGFRFLHSLQVRNLKRVDPDKLREASPFARRFFETVESRVGSGGR